MNAAQAVGVAIAMLAALGAGPALACGHCVEDRIAAVYDHALVQRTLAARHRIVYFAWEGRLPIDQSSRRRLLAQVEAVAGIDKESVRVSMEPAAIAVSFDPRRSDGASIEAAIQRKLAPLGVSLVPLQPAP